MLVIRGERWFSVPEVAQRLGVTRVTVHRWLSGARRIPGRIEPLDVATDTHTGQAYVAARALRTLGRAARGARRA